MARPITGTYPAYFENYVSQVKEDELATAFKSQQSVIDSFFSAIPEEKTNTGYAEGKWSLKELLQHIIDAERIFCYRALAFARKDKNSLPSFDENEYADNSNAGNRSWKSLCDELKTVRAATLALFESFTNEMLESSGIANNNKTAVLAVGFIIVGHLTHHKKIVDERYLNS